MITYNDIKVGGFEISLSKLVGKQVKDIRGYLSKEFGDVVFKMTSIVLEDDTKMGCEGEHEFPYLVQYNASKQPNFDDATLERLYEGR